MTSKELELLAKMTVRLLEKGDVQFVIETWKSIINDGPAAGGEKGTPDKDNLN
ncbi:MAG: hypothetical protein FWC55_01100 [Firmicutes bacterium]|nr:hypothetical protein [Bacillota bacterium]